MKKTKKSILCLLLSLLLTVSFFPIHASAAESSEELSQETIDRVYNEILTGNITNKEDVLKVALAQYENCTQATPATYSVNSSGPNSPDGENTSPTITQVLETTTNEDGTITKLVADTGLLVVDESGYPVYTDRLYERSFESLEDYDITARLTVYYYFRYKSDGIIMEEMEVKIHNMSTVLFYLGDYQATKLETYYSFKKDGSALPTQYLQASYTNPAPNKVYTNTPSQAAWQWAWDHPYPGFSCAAYVYYGSKLLEVFVNVNAIDGPDYDGTW